MLIWLENRFSSGYLLLPMNIMCSRKCASPYLCMGSFKHPQLTARETEARLPPLATSFELLSCTNRHWSPFSRVKCA